jgi:hypothetical protein
MSLPSMPKSFEDVPGPLQEGICQGLQPNETVRHLVFSPEFKAGKFRMFESVFCVTDRRWLALLRQPDGNISLDSAPFECTLLVALTIFLLHGGLQIDFAREGKTRSMVLHFNTVMERLYSAAIRDLLDGIDEIHSPGTLLDPNSREMLQDWPLKFQNYAVIYMPRGSPLVSAVHWNTLRGAFGWEVGPSAALLLSDRHLVLIAEEKSVRRFGFRRDAKYGGIISYIPRQRLVRHEITERRRARSLALELRVGETAEKLELLLPIEKCAEVLRLIQQAESKGAKPSRGTMNAT